MTPINDSVKLHKKLSLSLNGTDHDLYAVVGPHGSKFTDILKRIDPAARVDGADRVYNIVYRRFKYLARYGLFDLVRRSHVNWDKTQAARDKEIQNSVQSIFKAAIHTHPLVSTATRTADGSDSISTVKTIEHGFYVIPTGQLLYLFSQVQNSNSIEKSANKPDGGWWDKIYNIPKKCSSERITAVKTLMQIQGRGLFVRDLKCAKCQKTAVQVPGKKIAVCSCGHTWKPILNPLLKKELKEVKYNFDNWETEIQNKELFFDRGPGTAITKLPCRTRFTDRGRKVHNIKTYDRAWNRANLLFKRGVFVTLTTDPAMHKSLWHANRHLTRAFNRYLSLLLSRAKHNRKKGYDSEKDEHNVIDDGIGRLKYIAAYEFQENGLIHLHLIFFGIRYLSKIDDISEDWVKCGQGRIVHAYGVRRDGETWLWNQEKPTDTDGRSPVDYLRKYLEKALYVNDLFSMYWAINKRFCTMSRMFQTKECAGCRSVWGSALKVCPVCTGPLWHISQGYRFLGSLIKDTGPTAAMMLRNSGVSPFGPLGERVTA